MGVKLLLIAGLCLAFINGSYSEPVGTCPEVNEEDVTFLTDSNDCSIFYKCETGEPHLYQCPSDLYFNPEINVCDWPEQVDCGMGTGGNGNGGDNGNGENNGNGGDGGDGDGNGNGSGTGECPAENGEYVTLLPHETDCTLFYKCDWGTPVLQACPDGLHFNPTLSVCDFSEQAGCEGGTGGGDNGNGNGNGSGENGGGDGNGDGNGNGSGTGECPAENGEYVTLLPHETDCTLFYKCDWGTPILQACPDGLYFNPTLSVCDFSEQAGCEGGTGGGDNGNGNGNGSGENGGGDGNGNGSGTGECPAENGEYVTLLPHETDCTLFYKCDWGTPILQACPDGLHFNPTLSVCDFSEQAGCEGGTGGGDNGNGNGNGSGENGGGDGNGDGNGNGSGTGECPAENGEYVTLLPHETDCTLFYKCDWGTPILQACPDGLYFNPTLSVCDFSEQAGCEGGTGGGDNGNGNGNGSGENGGGDGNGDGNGNGNGNGSGTGECPAENGEYVTLLPHETDCTLFYKCDWGTPILQACPDGLYFNPTLSVCDFSEQAGCEGGTGGGDNGNGNGNGSGENGGGDGNGDGNGNGSGTGECPAENGEYVTLLPHETDCTLFYKCDWGTPILQACPDGLYFNPTLSVCDFSEQAGCEGGTGGGDNGNGNGNGSGENGGGDGNGNGSGTGECPAENGEYVTLLPHETDCTLFYKCDWGTPILQACPDGLHFNPTLSVCDFSEQAGCEGGTGGGDNGNGNGNGSGENGGGDGNGDGNGNGNGNGSGTGECPAENGEYVTLLPHETDCTLFYKCDWGTPILQACPDGLHFNPTLSVCDFSEQAGCEGGTGGGDNGNGNGNGSGENGGGDGNGDGNGNGSGTGECPAENGEYVTLLPHETDCTLFYKCDWGTPILQACPDGLHFNPTLSVCDFSEQAGCEGGTGGGDNGNGNGNGSGENGGGDGNGDGNGNGSGTGECPAENGEYVTLLPHETDCTLFYKCDWGTPILQACPDGLYFNPTLSVCDFSEQAGCEGGTGGGDNGNGNGNGSGENGGGDGNGDGNGNGNGNGSGTGECPAENGEYVTLLPHETDCTLFYKCDWGTPILQTCPDGLYFNPTLSVCDFSEQAGCEGGTGGGDNGNGGDIGNGSGEPGDGGDEDGNGDIDDGGSSGSGFCESLSCPMENDVYVYFIPYENDCTKFCKCDWGEAHEYDCPPGLYFNPELDVCDWPESSGCTM